MSDLQSLKDFLVLARLKSFSKAAEQCHVTSSGLSRRIQGLEIWLGNPVFDRTKPQLELTSAGCELRAVAADVVNALDGVKNSVRRRHAAQQNHIRLAAPHILSSVFFPAWLSDLHNQFGQAKLTVMSAALSDCMSALQRAEVDFVVSFEDASGGINDRLAALGLLAGIESARLSSETLVPVSAPDRRGQPQHRLAASSAPVPYLGFSDECSLGWALERAIPAMPGLPPLQLEHQSWLAEAIRSMALIGMGAAWLPTGQIQGDLQAGRLVSAAGTNFEVPLEIKLLRTPSDLGRRAEELWQTVRRAGARQKPPRPIAGVAFLA